MFEQQSYEYPPVSMPEPTPLAEGDLFRHYEIKSWELSPRIYKILAISAILNIAAVLFAAQTSLLTRKGCDSPLVGSVCQVLDTVYVGSLLFGTKRDYVDAVYERTKLGDDEDVTFIDASKETPPLTYPAGYFQIANPEQQMELAMIDDGTVDDLAPGGFNSSGNIPGIPQGFPMSHPSQGNTLFNTEQHVPKQNPHVLDGGPLPGASTGGTASNHNPIGRKNGRGGRIIQPNPAASPGATPEDTTAENKPPTEPAPTPMSSEAVMAVEINKKPLTDFADTIAAQWEAKEVDLSQDFKVVLNAVLTKDGKLDPKKSKFDTSKQLGDPKMIDVGKGALEALAESGWLTYMRRLNVDKMTVTLFQDDDKIVVQIVSGQKDENRARTVASGLNSIISVGKTVTQNPSDEYTLLEGAKVGAQGNNFILNFAIPKPVAQEMITRKLQEAQAKKAQQNQPNVPAPAKPGTPAG